MYNNFNKNITCYTLPNKFISHGRYEDLLKQLGLDENTIIKEIINKYE